MQALGPDRQIGGAATPFPHLHQANEALLCEAPGGAHDVAVRVISPHGAAIDDRIAGASGLGGNCSCVRCPRSEYARTRLGTAGERAPWGVRVVTGRCCKR